MKRMVATRLFSFAALALLLSAMSERNDVYPLVRNESFTKGETLQYKMTYTIFQVGVGSTVIHHDYHRMNNRDCFKVDVYGKTTGMVNWVADVDDNWGAYIDTVALVPQMTYRKIREGKYRKDEIITFDHKQRKIEAKVLDQKTGKFKEPKQYDAPPQVRDLIAGFMYMRTMDFSGLKPNDTVTVEGFYEDTVYKLKVLYKGKETIKVKAGKFRTIVMKPIMPDNKLFAGENSITVWFSDDKNRIPLKVNANMFIGSAGVELISYEGVRNPLNLIK
ncbi:MAG: DUF3108 domain-containing protein [Cyclobacteriaceae bacterium]|nr:DUF3108 domain-containing protein [Cyclobacteriaceae bacterium]